MRITTGAMMRNYNGRLNTILSNMNTAGERVTTKRKYDKASQDPASAARATKLRREYLNNEDYIANVKDAQSRMDTVESSVTNISKIAEDAYAEILTAVNGTTNADQRSIIAESLRKMQESMMQQINVSEAGDFIFGGSSTKEAPFTLSADGNLLYRGVDVTTGDPDTLKTLAEETIYVDLGFGLSIDSTTGQVDPNTAFNIANTGISYLGYGQNDDGTSKNIIVLLGQIANALEADPYDADVVDSMNKVLDTQRNEVVIGITKIGSNSKKLEYTATRLDDVQFNLTSKINSTEYISDEQAIMNFTQAKYLYSAALKVGTDILTNSLLDFMK